MHVHLYNIHNSIRHKEVLIIFYTEKKLNTLHVHSYYLFKILG